MDDVQLQTLNDVLESKRAKGDWAGKPAVPATTVTATNTSGQTMNVEITGGTVTAVKVDGVTVGGRTSGMFRVRNGSTIAWVGSAAPTWQWFYA
jgi:hypothetical protein